MHTIDFGRHSADYAAFRPGFPASFYQRLDAILPLHTARTLDLATGPGTMAVELAARGSTVVGIDVAAEQIAAAQRAAQERNLAHQTHFAVARAEATGLAANAFDLVTAGQCWHWFDRATTLAEIQRVLRPGGVLAIAHYSYLAAHAPVARDTEALVLSFHPAWTMAGAAGVFPEIIDEVIHGGFDFAEQFCYQHEEVFSHARWRGRMRTCNGVGSGGLSPDAVQRFDAALAHLLESKYPAPLRVPHRVWCVVARKRGGGGRRTPHR